MLGRKIRILHIIESGGPGGAETVLLNIVRNLDKNKYRSVVVLLRTGWLYQELKKSTISTTLLRTSRSCDLSFLFRLWLNVKERKIDLIHSHLPDVNLYSCLAGFAARIPIVTTYHGSPIEAQRRINSHGLKYPLIRTLSTRIVAVSDWLKDDLVKTAHFPPEKLKTIYNGVDWKRFDLPSNSVTKRKELDIGLNERVVGMVANLRPAKAYQYFVRAAAIVAGNIPQVKFLIIGEEDDQIRETVLEEIEAHGLTDKMLLLGFREDVPELLKLLDVFVLSSVSEGLSIATIEAMAAGVPAVVTESGGPREVVVEGRTGFLVPPKDEKSLAEKVMLLLENGELASSMGQEAQARVKTRFGIDAMIENYEAVYQECLNQRKGQV